VLTAPIPRAFEELEQAVGREQPLDFHQLLRSLFQGLTAGGSPLVSG